MHFDSSFKNAGADPDHAAGGAEYPVSGSVINDEGTLLQVTEDLLVNMSKLLR